MKSNTLAFISGILFGLGLAISQMINPAKVIAFLDLFGHWDASLGLVMAAALVVTGISFRFVTKCAKPACADTFNLPTRKDIDKRLIIGSAIFGIGWGMAGYCPGPAVSSLSLGMIKPVIFVAAMIAGMFLFKKRAH